MEHIYLQNLIYEFDMECSQRIDNVRSNCTEITAERFRNSTILINCCYKCIYIGAYIVVTHNNTVN